MTLCQAWFGLSHSLLLGGGETCVCNAWFCFCGVFMGVGLFVNVHAARQVEDACLMFGAEGGEVADGP